MKPVLAAKWRSRSYGNLHVERCRILWVAIILSLSFQVSARGQSAIPAAANAFEAKDSPLPIIRSARETDQGPQTGAYELQFWSALGDGLRIAKSNPNGRFWNVGLRFGYVVSAEHGPGLLRGRFEYVADVVPLIKFYLPGQTVSGAGIIPVGAKWDFVTRHRIAPYFELNGGGLFTNHAVPQGASTFNFTASTSLGVHVLRGRFNWSAEVRFYHVSNGGLTENPSFNTVGLSVGFGTFSRPGRPER